MTQNHLPIILMYHGTPNHKPASEYSIHCNLFKKHIEYLAKHGWNTICVSDLANTQQFDQKTLAITFDDGYLDNFEYAYATLQYYQMVATWFIATDHIDSYADWMAPGEEEYKMMDTSHLKQLASAGMEIGSHTCTHPDLTTLSFDRQYQELKNSREKLQDLLSKEVTSFAYPYGRFNDDSVKAVQKAGYRVSCTTRSGRSHKEDNPHLYRRVTIFAGDSVGTLARKLVFADNDVSWKKMAQYYGSRILSRLTG